jgi:hypothetical protein
MTTTKPNSSLAVTLVLLTFMLAVGIISAACGYAFGRGALKGTTQPIMNPILGDDGRTVAPSAPTGVDNNNFLNEKELIANVKSQVRGSAKAGESAEKSPEPDATDKAEAKKAEAQKSQTSQTNQEIKGNFPLTAQDAGVSLEVRSVKRQGSDVVLQVALKNDSAQPVEFMYTFLDVTDQQDRALTATTQGLPTELKAGSDTFVGTITIPQAALEDSKQVAISLANYPTQTLELQISDIPVVN